MNRAPGSRKRQILSKVVGEVERREYRRGRMQGFRVLLKLECGHTVWRPGSKMHAKRVNCKECTEKEARARSRRMLG